MLRFFRLQNWKSYYEPVEFSMVATRERRHGERVAAMGRSRVLPVTAIYGANAAGKSTFVDALEALRNLVVEAREREALLDVTPFLPKGKTEPTGFAIEFVAPVKSANGREREQVFLYEVLFDQRRIHDESLVLVKSQNEQYLFERTGDDVTLYGELDGNRDANAFAAIIAPNATFLGALGAVGEGIVAAAYSWFAQQLNIIHPGSEYVYLPARIDADEVFAQAMNKGLTRADTGISRLGFEDMKVGALPLEAADVKKLVEALRNKGGSFVIGTDNRDWSLLSVADDGMPIVRRLVAVHEVETGPDQYDEGFQLPLREESDGTQRFMNLLPILFQLRDEDARNIFVVDELENSMHPKLTEEFIASFLGSLDNDDRRQLIFTTHEIQLMRSGLLRRDEIWLADKADGESRLTRLSDFADVGVRKDADLLSFYMSGRIGGVPRV
ncbi:MULTISPECIES: ATP-binding protein [unclassified Actinobaculum]|uniref:AAA family ATPase n=1 Tax=unclassified Actinobaculum TaxID=2609299 RepID=UPI000D527D71|nr:MULTISPECIES: ATP-binding protein [unclassified Actinobaculum]AWE42098.1 ATP-binding protein [Actinobaculum sp. 313]RTE50652.1 ATP-binding protein [Actinobaculum sp. 352]